jgi:hypothetical protein
MSARTRKLLLWCAATDSTFALARVGERSVLAGKCIHCNRKLALELDGRPLGRETLEHIVPRHHGGSNALDNLAIACATCNQGKGVRHDPQRWQDEGLQRVIATLQARRLARLREPLEGLDLPPLGELEPEDEDDVPPPTRSRRRR